LKKCFWMMRLRLLCNPVSGLIILLFHIIIWKERTKRFTFIKIVKRSVNCPFLVITGRRLNMLCWMYSNPLRTFMIRQNLLTSNQAELNFLVLNLR
jgi:hypothetical protein